MHFFYPVIPPSTVENIILSPLNYFKSLVENQCAVSVLYSTHASNSSLS